MYMNILENLFLMGFICFKMMFDSLLPYYSLFLHLFNDEEDNEESDVGNDTSLSNKENVISWSLPSFFEPKKLQSSTSSVTEVEREYEISEPTLENEEFLKSIVTDLELTEPSIENSTFEDESLKGPPIEKTSTYYEAEESGGEVEESCEVIEENVLPVEKESELPKPSPNDYSTNEEYEVLSMDDWREISKTFYQEKDLRSSTTAHISDKLDGLQTWVCSIVGYENTYIHVLDNETRAWVDLGEFKELKIAIDDIVELVVERSGTKIVLQKITVLKTSSAYINELFQDGYSFEEHELYMKTAEA